MGELFNLLLGCVSLSLIIALFAVAVVAIVAGIVKFIFDLLGLP